MTDSPEDTAAKLQTAEADLEAIRTTLENLGELFGDAREALTHCPAEAVEHADSVRELVKFMADYDAGDDPFEAALARLRVLAEVQEATDGAEFDELPNVMKRAQELDEELTTFGEVLAARLGKNPIDQLAIALWRLHLLPVSAGAEDVANALADLCDDTPARLPLPR